MTVRRYGVLWTNPAGELLQQVADKQTQRKLLDAADGLASDPSQQGKALTHELSGFRRIRYSRYRIVYGVDEDQGTVWVVAVGMRHQGKPRDVYEVARKLLRSGLLEAEE